MLVKKWDIHQFGEIESTNLIIKEQIKRSSTSAGGIRDQGLGISETPRGDAITNPYSLVPNPYGYVAVAKSQTGGKGMRGHSWCSPEGGLYFSLVLEPTLPPEKLPEIPLRIATVVMNALQPLCTELLTIKPPNDIVLLRSAEVTPSQTISFDSLRSSQDDVSGEEDRDRFTTYSGNKSSEADQDAGEPHFNRSATSGHCKVDDVLSFPNHLVNDSSEVSNCEGLTAVNRSATSDNCKVDDVLSFPNHLVNDSSEVSNCEGLTAVNRSATSGHCKVDDVLSFPNHLVNDSSEVSNCEGLTAVNRSATSGHCKVEKLVGISTEIYLEILCVGIGINIFLPEEELQVEGINKPVYLEDFSKCDLSIDSVLQTVLDALNAKLEI